MTLSTITAVAAAGAVLTGVAAVGGRAGVVRPPIFARTLAHLGRPRRH
jgi:hypothetical protein